ncbi:MAG: dihydroorotate dehydrogenase electron transfer subunit [Euryarchaeota archaeon]|nr:dihydroorotate dehydrogenase electron transfer subunit [Euryarchaeota archaeon]
MTFTTRVTRVVEENPKVRTIHFRHEKAGEARPGQFVMVWIPGVDEVPMSLSKAGRECAVTVGAIGDATSAMAGMKKGDVIGIRGPYGRPYSMTHRRILFVGGGTGIASIATAVEAHRKKRRSCTVALGARTKELIFFANRFKRAGAKVRITTDDGSMGEKRFVTDTVEEELRRGAFDAVYTCGPEKMMARVVDIANAARVEVEASLERHMRCGFGICGACTLDDGGERVCQEGPMFTGKELRKITEFGKYHRDASGRKVA